MVRSALRSAWPSVPMVWWLAQQLFVAEAADVLVEPTADNPADAPGGHFADLVRQNSETVADCEADGRALAQPKGTSRTGCIHAEVQVRPLGAALGAAAMLWWGPRFTE